MGRPLIGKKQIMDYTGMGEIMLDEVIRSAGFPHFVVGQKMCSHTDSVDRWFVEASMRRGRIGGDGDGEGGDGDKEMGREHG